jgi:uncharacterized phage protein (TIGR01671 family)
MSREINFRGQRIDNKEWVYGSLVMVCDGESLKRHPCIVVSYNCDSFDWHEVDKETVEQFIGLCDKKGKTIYEGDFIKNDKGVVYKVKYRTPMFILEAENGVTLGINYNLSAWEVLPK